MNRPIESLEPRQLLATTIDTTWRFNQGSVDAAARTHLDLDQVTDAGRGRVVMVGRTLVANSYGRSVIVALDSSGSLDRTFSGDGLADPGLAGAVRVISSPDGYVYAVSTDGVVRFRGDGGRDRSFGGAAPVGLPASGPSVRVLAAIANAQNGVDLVRVFQRPTGGTVIVDGSPEPEYDGIEQLIRVDANGARVVWQSVFSEGVPDGTLPSEVQPDLRQAQILPLRVGGHAIVSLRQRYTYAHNNSQADPHRAEVIVHVLNATGEPTRQRVFDIGEGFGTFSHVRVDPGGRWVKFVYDDARREVTWTDDDKITRQTYRVGAGTPGLTNGQVVLLSGTPLFPGSYHSGVYTLSLANADGSLDKRFATNGLFDFANLPIDGAYSFSIDHAQPGSALISWQRTMSGQKTRYISRLWLADQPVATLLSAGVRDRTATVTVQYHSPTGIAPRTVGSPDLLLYSKRKPYAMRLIDSTVTSTGKVGDIVTARYRADNLPRGVFAIDLQGAQIGTMSNTVNIAERLGEFEVD